MLLASVVEPARAHLSCVNVTSQAVNEQVFKSYVPWQTHSHCLKTSLYGFSV